MPLLSIVPTSKSKFMKIELDGSTSERLRRYCSFSGNGKESSVIREALNYVFDADKEFTEWQKNPENVKPRPKIKRRPKSATSTVDHQTTA